MKKKTLVLLTALIVTFNCSPVVHAAESTQITSVGTADITVTGTVGSTFTVGIPTNVTLASDGSGDFKITVKGDLSPAETLHVSPTDTVNEAEGINFLLQQKGVLNSTETLQVNVTDPKTDFTYQDINPDTDTEVACTLQTASGNIPAGSWEGVLTYNINLTSN